MITIEYLKKILHEPETGKWTWLVKVNRKIKIGQQAGTFHNGYRIITINRRRYRSARLAWFYMTGEWPIEKIDHKYRNKSNDKWTNLRIATHQQNSCNVSTYKTNKLGIKGVCFKEEITKYRAYINNTHLGYFNTISEAAQQIHGEFSFEKAN